MSPVPERGLPQWFSGKESACNAGDPGLIPGSGRSPGEGNDCYSNILAWRIPQVEEPGGLQSMGLQRVRHNSATNSFAFIYFFFPWICLHKKEWIDYLWVSGTIWICMCVYIYMVDTYIFMYFMYFFFFVFTTGHQQWKIWGPRCFQNRHQGLVVNSKGGARFGNLNVWISCSWKGWGSIFRLACVIEWDCPLINKGEFDSWKGRLVSIRAPCVPACDWLLNRVWRALEGTQGGCFYRKAHHYFPCNLHAF